tara:strand:- start:2984 stop:3478 length:495 start_codon:yes stop_codon:yes gene_type:complete
MNTQSFIVIGKILSTHGIKGWISIQSYSYPKENIKNYDTFIKINGSVEEIKIIDFKIMPKKFIINIKNYNSINKSELIVGKNILVSNSDMPTLNSNEYYWKDLEGLDVMTSKNRYLGKVDFIFNNGANDVIALKDNNIHSYVAYVKEHINIVPNEKIIINDEYI